MTWSSGVIDLTTRRTTRLTTTAFSPPEDFSLADFWAGHLATSVSPFCQGESRWFKSRRRPHQKALDLTALGPVAFNRACVTTNKSAWSSNSVPTSTPEPPAMPVAFACCQHRTTSIPLTAEQSAVSLARSMDGPMTLVERLSVCQSPNISVRSTRNASVWLSCRQKSDTAYSSHVPRPQRSGSPSQSSVVLPTAGGRYG